MSQAKSMRYGAHLAIVLAKEDTNAERNPFLRDTAGKLKVLHDRAFRMLTGTDDRTD